MGGWNDILYGAVTDNVMKCSPTGEGTPYQIRSNKEQIMMSISISLFISQNLDLLYYHPVLPSTPLPPSFSPSFPPLNQSIIT